MKKLEVPLMCRSLTANVGHQLQQVGFFVSDLYTGFFYFFLTFVGMKI